MTRRRLRPDELELWNKVARSTDRMAPRTIEMPEDASAKRPPRKKDPVSPQKPLSRFEVGQATRGKPPGHMLHPTAPEQVAQAPLRMDKKAHGKLKRGKLKPEARIDLHGMTMAQAQPALTGFIMRAFNEGQRLVLVITGKGKRSADDGPIPQRPGVLRHNVPHWLQSAPLSSMVLQITPAHLRHGGDGAYYVYLRRSRQ
jgi:DNA-nicking Smr family endonuclease